MSWMSKPSLCISCTSGSDPVSEYGSALPFTSSMASHINANAGDFRSHAMPVRRWSPHSRLSFPTMGSPPPGGWMTYLLHGPRVGSASMSSFIAATSASTHAFRADTS